VVAEEGGNGSPVEGAPRTPVATLPLRGGGGEAGMDYEEREGLRSLTRRAISTYLVSGPDALRQIG